MGQTLLSELNHHISNQPNDAAPYWSWSVCTKSLSEKNLQLEDMGNLVTLCMFRDFQMLG